MGQFERDKARVTFDSNLWVSMAMGGRIARLATLLSEGLLETYVCSELISSQAKLIFHFDPTWLRVSRRWYCSDFIL